MTAKPKSSKRQQLKALQKNDLNKTPQQPRIKSAAQRAKSDILQSGLGLKVPNEKNKPQQLLNPDLDLNSPEVKFGRSLASSDASGRHKSVNKLKFYLKARCDIANENGGFSELDLMKLWKGLWYCLYMADKVPVQDELSKRLSELIWCFEGTEEEDEYAAQMYLNMDGGDEAEVSEDEEGEEDDYDVTMEVVKNTLASSEKDDDMSEDEVDESDESDDDMMEADEGNTIEPYLMKHCRGAHLAALFIRTFFATVRREWGNMDKYRVDKFYTLIRFMMAEVYKYMAKRHWNYGITRLFNDHLHEEILSKIPNGIRYHIVDLALDQLAIVNKKYAPLPLTESTYIEVLEPFFGLCQSEQNVTVQSRAVEKVLKKFLYEYSVVGDKFLEENKEGNDEEDCTFENVHVGSISEFIFSLASHEETKDKYRKTLYAIYKDYEKRLKKVGKDVKVEDDEMDEEADMGNGDDEMDETKENDSLQKDEESVKNETSVEPKKSKGKKSKKNKRKQESEETTVDNVVPLNQDKSSQEVSKKKKRKKSQKKEDNTDVATEKAEAKDLDDKNQSKNPDITPSETKKKEKKSKKKKKSAEDDEVFVISTSDQKQAMESSTSQTKKVVPEKKKKKKSKANVQLLTNTDKVDDIDEDDDGTESAQARRVSFGRTNFSKSYKASMKGLKTMDHPGTAARTPEKGILMKKAISDAKAASEAAKGKKKRSKKSKKSKK